MFQTYDPVSDRSFGAKHLPALRIELERAGLDGFLVPHDDEYQNEYIPAYAERLMWISGFSGSAGSAIVMLEKAVIFVDGRYTLQVRDQTDDAFFSFEDITERQPMHWLEAEAGKGTTIGYDPLLHSVHDIARLQATAKRAGFTLRAVEKNPVDAAWSDQPAKPKTLTTPHPIAYAGETSKSKRSRLAANFSKSAIDAALITTPPSVAWLFNIRGGDVDRTPLPLSRAILFADGSASLFLNSEKRNDTLIDHLGPEITLFEESDLEAQLQKLGAEGKSVRLDPSSAPSAFESMLKQSGAQILHGDDPCTLPKACKNTAEIEGTRAAHIRDGVAVTKFLHWLATEGQSGDVDEIAAARALETFRREDNTLKDLSFDSISGAGSNGAIVHYRVTTPTNRKLEKGSLFLIDSGGQYPDGTTDITRTVAIDTPTQEMRDRYTRVLQGHIALATARFPAGTSGSQLDGFARAPLWQAGLDYDHGTGHGVGSFLGVHEGPQRIAKMPNSVALRPGMILSNEPGFYKSGAFGIRIENLIIVEEPSEVGGGERAMMSFETITLAPLSRELIDSAILSDAEIDWVNAYHQRVRETLGPLLTGDVKAWNEAATAPIARS